MDLFDIAVAKKLAGGGGGVTPTGNCNITSTAQTDVSAYATAQVVDADLVASNIKKDVDILGVVGTYEGGGGGGDSLTLLNTTDLGALNITSTTETTLTQLQVSNINDYEVLILLCERSERSFGKHIATLSAILLIGTGNFREKSAGVTTSKVVYRDAGDSGILSKQYGAGLYPDTSPTVSGGGITITIKAKANNSNAGDISGNYTAKVYGAKFADLLNL